MLSKCNRWHDIFTDEQQGCSICSGKIKQITHHWYHYLAEGQQTSWTLTTLVFVFTIGFRESFGRARKIQGLFIVCRETSSHCKWNMFFLFQEKFQNKQEGPEKYRGCLSFAGKLPPIASGTCFFCSKRSSRTNKASFVYLFLWERVQYVFFSFCTLFLVLQLFLLTWRRVFKPWPSGGYPACPSPFQRPRWPLPPSASLRFDELRWLQVNPPFGKKTLKKTHILYNIHIWKVGIYIYIHMYI